MRVIYEERALVGGLAAATEEDSTANYNETSSGQLEEPLRVVLRAAYFSSRSGSLGHAGRGVWRSVRRIRNPIRFTSVFTSIA